MKSKTEEEALKWKLRLSHEYAALHEALRIVEDTMIQVEEIGDDSKQMLDMKTTRETLKRMVEVTGKEYQESRVFENLAKSHCKARREWSEKA